MYHYFYQIIATVVQEHDVSSRRSVVVLLVLPMDLLWWSRTIKPPKDVEQTRTALLVKTSDVIAYVIKIEFVRTIFFVEVVFHQGS
jgi:hypothetical protein